MLLVVLLHQMTSPSCTIPNLTEPISYRIEPPLPSPPLFHSQRITAFCSSSRYKQRAILPLRSHVISFCDLSACLLPRLAPAGGGGEGGGESRRKGKLRGIISSVLFCFRFASNADNILRFWTSREIQEV